MTVRVANDFKTEAQHAHEQLALDNKTMREKIRGLENQIEKLNKSKLNCCLDYSIVILEILWNDLILILNFDT